MPRSPDGCIMDGTLDAALVGDAELIGTLDVIRAWVGSTFALFAEGLPSCPSAS